MAINFSIGDYVIPNKAFIMSLKKSASTPLLKQTIESLSNLVGQPSQVMDTGSLTYPAYSYIKVLPNNVQHILYKKGQGAVFYFANDDQLNSSFEVSQAFLNDQEIIRCLNNSGSGITRSQIVRQVGFDATTQQPTIGLASATSITNALILGVAQEDIPNGASGEILISGSFQVDTSAFTLGATAFLSNTPGSISITSGDINSSVGRVLSIGTQGTVSTSSALTGSSGGGGTEVVDVGGAAFGWVKFSSPVADDWFSINGRVYCFNPTGGVTYDVAISGLSTWHAKNAVNNDSLAIVDAMDRSSMLILVAKEAGASGGSITLAESTSDTRLIVSASDLHDGKDAVQRRICTIQYSLTAKDITELAAGEEVPVMGIASENTPEVGSAAVLRGNAYVPITLSVEFAPRQVNSHFWTVNIKDSGPVFLQNDLMLLLIWV